MHIQSGLRKLGRGTRALRFLAIHKHLYHVRLYTLLCFAHLRRHREHSKCVETLLAEASCKACCQHSCHFALNAKLPQHADGSGNVANLQCQGADLINRFTITFSESLVNCLVCIHRCFSGVPKATKHHFPSAIQAE